MKTIIRRRYQRNPLARVLQHLFTIFNLLMILCVIFFGFRSWWAWQMQIGMPKDLIPLAVATKVAVLLVFWAAGAGILGFLAWFACGDVVIEEIETK